LIRTGMLALGLLLALPTQAAEQRVYLVATMQLDGSSLAQSIFLHEPGITELEGCREAVRAGQRDRDWQKYHHIFRSDRFKGFSGHMQYRCATSDQRPAIQWLARRSALQPVVPDWRRRTFEAQRRTDVEPGPMQSATTGVAGCPAGASLLRHGQPADHALSRSSFQPSGAR